MRAAFYESVGPATDVIRVGERPTPEPGPGEVRIRIHVSGVNPSDVNARVDARGALTYPYVIPQYDGLGVIESVGRGVDPRRTSERVWTWNAAWKRPFRTCAEIVCLPSDQAVSLPMDTDFEGGACLGIPAMTACRATLCDGSLAERQRTCALTNEALEAGVLTNTIGARVALRETALAHVAVESGSAVGNVVATVE